MPVTLTALPETRPLAPVVEPSPEPELAPVVHLDAPQDRRRVTPAPFSAVRALGSTAPQRPARSNTHDSTRTRTLGGDALDHRLLTAEEEVEVAQRIEAGLYAAHLLETGTHPGVLVEELEWLVNDGVAARTMFITSNLRLAKSTARKFIKRGFTEEDVVQDAYIGLVKAVERFDYTRGFKFSTYAVWWIRESLQIGCRESAFVKHPEGLWNQIVKVRAVRLRLLDETGAEPSTTQLAEACELTEMDVLRCFASERLTTSLQTPLGEDGVTLGELVGDDEAPLALGAVEDAYDRDLLDRVVAAALASVKDPLVLHIIKARFGLDGQPPRSLGKLAAELGMTRQQIRHREQKGLKALRAPEFSDCFEAYRNTVA